MDTVLEGKWAVKQMLRILLKLSEKEHEQPQFYSNFYDHEQLNFLYMTTSSMTDTTSFFYTRDSCEKTLSIKV